MQCSECGSADVSTGVADHVSCFSCGFHGPHKHTGKPSPTGEEAVETAVEVDADETEGE